MQTLLGKLADEGVIDPQRIGATGGSYGGGMSLQLGALKDRVELPNGELIPWESPGGKPMKIAATAPEFPWTDLAQALMPNGSDLDYVADSPYAADERGPPLRDRKEQLERHAVPRRQLVRLLLDRRGQRSEANLHRRGTTSTSPAVRTTASRWRSSRKNSFPTTAPTTRT